MKKGLLTAAAILAANVMVNAQGKFETVELRNSTLRVYYSNDVMADASYIVAGKDALVVLEAPLFKNALAEFDSYIKKPENWSSPLLSTTTSADRKARRS